MSEAATPPTPDLAAVRELDALIKLRRAINGLRVSETEAEVEVSWADEIDSRLNEYVASVAAVSRPAPLPVDVQAAVERVREWLDGKRWAADTRTADDIAMPDDGSLMMGDLRALLAAVSRPAEARGEPDYWAVVDSIGTLDDCCESRQSAYLRMSECNSKYPRHAPFKLVPLYAHSAPSGGEAVKCKWDDVPCGGEECRATCHAVAPRPETGEVSEAMVEAGVEGWIAAINDSYSLARMEHEVSRHEIVGHILRAALAVCNSEQND